MTKKLISLFAVSALVIATLVSCKIWDSGKNDNHGNGDNENVIYDNGKEVTIVYNDTDIDPEILGNISSKLTNAGFAYPKYANDQSTKSTDEIVLGITNRQISEKAYEQLERYKDDKESENTLCFLIYSDGSSIAIAYEEHKLFDDFALSRASEYLVDKIIDDNTTLSKGTGVLYKAIVDPIEAQRELDEIQLEEEWESLSTALEGYENADAVISALRNFYTLFNTDLLLWYADLYDPVSGGFYYSNSARNTEGFLPDIETTNQVMTFLRNSKMTDDPYSVISEDMRLSMIRFVKERQDPDGYFYHPQWEGMNYTVERLSRDLNWATALLKGLGATPTYTTPLGWKGDGIRGDGSSVSSAALTGRLSSSAFSAVSSLARSNVIGTASMSDIFASRDTFKSYLDGLDLLANSYEIGNLIATLSARVKSEGYTDILVKWLDGQQNPENGLWYYKKPGDSGYSIYDGVNGLFKISAAYNTVGRPIPNPERAIASAIEATVTEETPATVCYFYNTWCSIYNVFHNLRTYSGLSAADANVIIKPIQKNLIDNAPAAIEATMNKALLFRKNDGSYSMLQNNSAASSAGMPVALPNTFEGDVNATNIAGVSVVTNMMAALGLPMVSVYTKADLYEFLLRIDSLGEIVKDELFIENPMTFDKSDEFPFGLTYNLFGDGTIGIVEDKAHGSRVLEFFTQNDETNSTQSNLRFAVTEASESDSFEAFIFESDLKFVPGEGRGSAMHYFTFKAPTGTKFQLLFMSDTNGNVTIAQKLIGIKCEEWFKVRLEYFGKTGKDGEQVATVRVYVNGEYKFDVTTTNEKYMTPVVEELNGLSIDYSSDNKRLCTLYLDNVSVKQGALLEDRTNAEDYAERLTFEHSSDKSIPASVSSSLYGESKVYVKDMIRDGESTKALLLSAVPGGGSNLTFSLMKTLESYTALVLDTQIYFASVSDPTKSVYYYPEFRASSGAVLSVTMRSYNGNAEIYLGGAWVRLGKTDEWHAMRLEYHSSEGLSAVRIFFNEEYVGEVKSASRERLSDISSVRISYSGDNKISADVYLDNLSVYQGELTPPPKNDVDENGVYTFDTTEIGKLPTGVTFNEGGAKSESTAEVVDFEDGRGGVLKFSNPVDNAGASSANTKGSVLFAANGSFTDRVIFKLDFKIDDTESDLAEGMVEDGSSKQKYIGTAAYRLRALNSSGGEVFRLHYSFDKYGEAKLAMVNSGGATVARISLPGGTFAKGNWINLTLDVQNVETDGTVSTVIYVTATGYNKARSEMVTVSETFNLSEVNDSPCDLSSVISIGFQRYDAGTLDSSLYFDNVLITDALN